MPPTRRTDPGPLVDRVALFAEDRAGTRPLKSRTFATEADLRRVAERRLASALGLRLVAREVPGDAWTAGRIDALAHDDRGRPVVVESERTASGGAIGQALVYLDGVLTRRGAVALMVAQSLGFGRADRLDWSGARLARIPEEIGPQEEAVARQLEGKVETCLSPA